jgi:hypothetical protein
MRWVNMTQRRADLLEAMNELVLGDQAGSRGRHCHPTITLTVVDHHPLGIYIVTFNAVIAVISPQHDRAALYGCRRARTFCRSTRRSRTRCWRWPTTSARASAARGTGVRTAARFQSATFVHALNAAHDSTIPIRIECPSGLNRL